MSGSEQQRYGQLAHVLVPAIIAGLMICSCVLPWLKDPLGDAYRAWNVPVDIGWQVSSPFFNYGLLCLLGFAAALIVAWMQWKARSQARPRLPWFVRSIMPLGIFCLIPASLFFWQSLFVDLQRVDVFAQHDLQVLLIKQHLGYSTPGQVLSLSPFAVSNTTLQGRLEIVINHLSLGFLFVCVAAGIAIGYAPFFAPPTNSEWEFRFGKMVALSLGVILLLILFGRAPAALVCEYQAKQALAEGIYSPALQWLDKARALNPQLEQMPYYHRELGQAWASLYPSSQNLDSFVYLAFIARSQQDYLGAYHELLSVWPRQAPAWAVDEMSITLVQLSEAPQQSNALSRQQMLDSDLAALPWLQALSRIDSLNVYSAYVLGRIDYERHSYDDCQTQMRNVVRLSRNAYVLSSAYTYIALSIEKQGNTIEAREILLDAVKLDPYYHNNIAREELSGLH